MGYSLEGLGMARPTYRHQQAITQMIINYWLMTRFREYVVVPEPAANPEDGCSKVPDLGFYKVGGQKKPLVIVEISDSEASSREMRGKLYSYADLWELRGYRFKELFHFDFYKSQATRYDFKNRTNWGVDAFTTHSELLEIDLTLLLEPLPG